MEILRRPKNFSSEVEIMLLVVETRSDIRGEIARTYMYMYSVYPGRGIISKKIGNFLMHGIKVTLLLVGNVREQRGLSKYMVTGMRW